MEISKQHVQIPNMDLKKQGLTLNDPYIYACIKRYMNFETKQAYPQVSTIVKESGLDRKTILNGLKRLEQAGYINITKRPGTSSVYTFNDYNKFEIFSFDFLNDTNLSPRDKSMIVMSQQFMFKDPIAQNGIITYSNKQLANYLNIDSRTLQKYEKSLEDKHILVKIPDNGNSNLECNYQRIYSFPEFANTIALKFLETDSKIESLQSEHEDLSLKYKELQEKLEHQSKTINALVRHIQENKEQFPDIIL